MRRIIRAADIFSHRLASQHGVTVPQLICLTRIVEADGITIKKLSNEVFLSPSTVVGIIDRLETRKLVQRQRSGSDRRLVHLLPTDLGKQMAAQCPSPLQDALATALQSLPDDDQQSVAMALERLVSLMEIDKVDAAPILETLDNLTGTAADVEDHTLGGVL